MNLYTIILFLIFILPGVYKEYKKDSNKNISAKYINLLMTIIIFSIYSNIVRAEIREFLFNYESLKLTFRINVGFNSPSFNKMTWVMYVFVSFFTAITAIPLALRKEKARIFFLKLLPFIWIFGSIQLYKYTLTNMNLNSKNLFFYALLIEGILSLLLFLLYYSKFMKKFFQFTLEEIE